MSYLGFDIGGTWIKGTYYKGLFKPTDKSANKMKYLEVKKVKSPFQANANPKDLVEGLDEIITSFNINKGELTGIGISTTGIVDYAGTKIIAIDPYLNILKSRDWIHALENNYQTTVSLINDADAAAIGLAESGYLNGKKAIGIMPIGTGLGLSIWRNGRRWRPAKLLPLIGSIKTIYGDFNELASASKLAAKSKNNNLVDIFCEKSYQDLREAYILELACIIYSTSIIYGLDEIIICGGLADVSYYASFPLEKRLQETIDDFLKDSDHALTVRRAEEGNQLQLIGVLALANANSIALKQQWKPPYNTLVTEMPYDHKMQLENMRSSKIIESLWKAEQEAGTALKSNLPIIADVCEECVTRLEKGGRIIYVGAGTSGRIAAMDAVEIPCTYGFPESHIITLVAGGIVDAAYEIESNFEEDASAAPEMLLLNINKNDIVIGISASGTAFYVQSALAFAQSRAALTIFIMTSALHKKLPFCNYIIPLHSGNEVIAGSTRMKAGTATKKVLNFLSTTLMIRLGKVKGSYLIDMKCLNNKLVDRAHNILTSQFNLNSEQASELLEQSGMSIDKAVKLLLNK